MPQQVNLCTPILLTQKRYFSAHTMAMALVAFLLLGGTLCGAWVWNLDNASESLKQSMTSQTREVENLKAAIQRSRANAAPVDPALLAQLDERRAAIAQRLKLQEALKEGMFRQGWGHSDRLTWVARSIPAPVWITDMRMDGTRFEVSGFTLEPSALNDWVDKLSSSPLMQGLKLATVKVESASAASTPAVDGALVATSGQVPPQRAVWSYSLVSVEPAAPVSLPPSAPGGKP